MNDELEEVEIHWYCGCYVGPSKWRFSGDWVLEPDECTAEGTFWLDREDWDDLAGFGFPCPECGTDLEVGDGHFQLEDGTTDLDVYMKQLREEKCQSSSKSEPPKAETTPSS